MELVAGLVLGLVLASALVVPIVMLLARREPPVADTEELEWGLRGLADEQRRIGEELLQRMQDANRLHLDHQRDRVTTELDGKKALIDQQLGAMNTELGKVGELVRGLDADRRTAFGQLANELQRQHEGLDALTENTRQLREALASQKVRGQWGERIAEDVLRLSGFLEGVNYLRQHTLADSGGRPDYTFLMPNGLVMHMDVKFPLDNYLRYLDADSELEQRRYRDQFLKDVRDRVRELTGRSYLDATTETVDCLLLFIPNEQVYAFVQEHDRKLLDDALRHKIVVCSPLTLYAVLAVVRQAVDNFRLEKTSNEILKLLADFSQQWEKYVVQLDKVKQRFDAVGKEYDTLMTTRHRMLQRQLDKVEALQHEEPALADAPRPPFALEG
jgi:DNA recombination protein RmuC